MKIRSQCLSRESLIGRDLRDWEFTDCDLSGVQFDRADLSRAKFVRCRLNTSSDDKDSWARTNRRWSPSDRVELKRSAGFVSFRGACLQEAFFLQCEMIHAMFVRADLSGATFVRSAMPKSDFHRALCYSAAFLGTDLSEAVFRHSHLDQARFLNCNLRSAVFFNARLPETKIFHTNCRLVTVERCNLKRLTIAFSAALQLSGSANHCVELVTVFREPGSENCISRMSLVRVMFRLGRSKTLRPSARLVWRHLVYRVRFPALRVEENDAIIETSPPR